MNNLYILREIIKMAAKTVIISSSGLKNIVLNKYQEEEDFTFVFGETVLSKIYFTISSDRPNN